MRVWRLWIRIDEAVLEPVCSCGPGLPNSLIDLLDTDDREEEEEEKEENQNELDFNERDGK